MGDVEHDAGQFRREFNRRRVHPNNLAGHRSIRIVKRNHVSRLDEVAHIATGGHFRRYLTTTEASPTATKTENTN